MKKLKFIIPAFLIAVFFLACAKEEVVTQSTASFEQVESNTQNEKVLKQNTTTIGDKEQSLSAALPPWVFAIQVIGSGNTQQQTLYLREVGTIPFTPVKSRIEPGLNRFLFSFDWSNWGYIKIDKNKSYELMSMSGRSIKFNFYSCYPTWGYSTVPYGNTQVERTWYTTGQSFIKYSQVPCMNIIAQ